MGLVQPGAQLSDDTKRYTEREYVTAQREAYVKGAQKWACYSCADNIDIPQAQAKHDYPLPRVTRPRVVRDEYGRQWRAINGDLFFREDGMPFADKRGWRGIDDEQWHLDSHLIPTWADLLANPTEIVDEDAP